MLSMFQFLIVLHYSITITSNIQDILLLWEKSCHCFVLIWISFLSQEMIRFNSTSNNPFKAAFTISVNCSLFVDLINLIRSFCCWIEISLVVSFESKVNNKDISPTWYWISIQLYPVSNITSIHIFQSFAFHYFY